MVSRVSRYVIHNIIMAMAIQFTSNCLITDLVDFVYSLPVALDSVIDSSPQNFIGCLFLHRLITLLIYGFFHPFISSFPPYKLRGVYLK